MVIGLPLWVLSGIILFLLMQSPRSPKVLTILVAIVFGAATSTTVFAILQGFQAIFTHKS